MAASWDESRVVTPFMPSLQHCASVKIAVQLFQEFGVHTLEEAFTEIKNGNLTTLGEYTAESRRAKESFLHIPAHLRGGVMKAVQGSKRAVESWTSHHYKFMEEKSNLRWRSDGSIDTVKTAQNLFQDAKMDIGDRFELACEFCLEKSVQALWGEMGESGHIKTLRASHEGVVSFWVKRLREQPRVSWTQHLVQSLGTWVQPFLHRFYVQPQLVPRFIAFFPLLRPEERQMCFDLLVWASADDLRFCLYTLTKDEEERMLLNKRMVYTLLRLHLEWPLQSLFLGTAAKLWDCIDVDIFSHLLLTIFNLIDEEKDCNYSELFERFWDMSPVHLRENVREEPLLRQKIDSYFDGKRKRENLLMRK